MRLLNFIKKEKREPETIESQEKMILRFLQNGNSITSLQALHLFGCFRLSGRIFDLKQKGYNITTEMIITTSEKRIASYKLVVK